MERSEIVDAMSALRLYGMRAAYDEILTTAVKRSTSRSASLASS